MIIVAIPEARTTIEATTTNMRLAMFGLSLDRLFSIANTIYIGAVVVAAVASFAIYQLSQQISLRDADEKQASRDQVEIAKSEAAKANERAAEANARAVEAQLALERFKAPRLIAESDKTRLVASISGFFGTKAAIYILGDGPEPNSLAASIHGALTEAHWEPLSWNWSGAGAAVGVLIFPKPGSDVAIEDACDSLVAALNLAHIASIKQTWPGDWDHFGGMLNGPNPPAPTAAPIRIVIGTKPQ